MYQDKPVGIPLVSDVDHHLDKKIKIILSRRHDNMYQDKPVGIPLVSDVDQHIDKKNKNNYIAPS
jgi:hypothetical protein